AIGAVHTAGGGVGRVALGAHPRVPIVVGGRRVLDLDRLQPRVLTGRLVEVAVDCDEPVLDHGSSRALRNARRPPRGTTTSPEESTCQRWRSAAWSRPISASAGTMLKRSTIARRSRAPLPTVVWSMMIESSITAPSLTHTLRPRIELRMV